MMFIWITIAWIGVFIVYQVIINRSTEKRITKIYEQIIHLYAYLKKTKENDG